MFIVSINGKNGESLYTPKEGWGWANKSDNRGVSRGAAHHRGQLSDNGELGSNYCIVLAGCQLHSWGEMKDEEMGQLTSKSGIWVHGVMTKGKSGHWAASLNGQHSKKQDTKGRLATGKWGSTVHCTVGLGAPLSKRGETRGEVTTGEGGGGGQLVMTVNFQRGFGWQQKKVVQQLVAINYSQKGQVRS